jgi:GntR family transcriptional regulator
MAKPSHVDRDSPLPLYHQIAVTLRYRIATGQIAAGTALPSYRLAAGEWGANLHTVRRAYQELQQEGLIRIDDRRGAVVIRQPGRGAGGAALHRFLAETIRTARELYGADLKTIIAALHRSAEDVGERPPVWIVECSKALALALAEQITMRWGVEARPWLVDRVREVPPGAIVSTYFHFNDLRHALPDRLVDLEFVHIRPSAAVLDVVRNRLRQVPGHRVQVLETDAAFAHGLLADLHHYLGTDVVIDLQIPSDPAAFLRQRTGRDPVLVSPKNWDRLDQSLRRRSHVYELAYVADESDLKRAAQHLGWRPAKQLAGAVV